MSTRQKILVFMFFLLVFSFSFFAVSYAAFENVVTTTVRAQGMGDAFCSISDEPASILINPAGITKLKRMSLGSSYSNLFFGLVNDLVYNSLISFSTPIQIENEKTKNAIGALWSLLGSNKYSENIFAFSYAHQIFESLSVGGTLKILFWNSARTLSFNSEEEGPLSNTSISLDAGLIYKPDEAISFGLTLGNLNQPNIVSSSSKIEDHLPLEIRTGGSFSLEKLLISFDFINKYYTYQERTESTVCVGAEQDLAPLFKVPLSVRGGVNFPFLNGTNLSFGGSYKNLENDFPFQIDYAMIISLFQANLFTHRFSFTTSFAPVQEALKEEMRKREEELKRLEEEKKKLEEKKEEIKEKAGEAIKLEERTDGLGIIIDADIIFSEQTSVLSSEGFSILDRALEMANLYPENKIRVEGHTDSTGSWAANMKLSLERAQAVANYLVSKGIDKSRISSRGYGADKPVDSNDTETGRKQNRRIEIIILKW